MTESTSTVPPVGKRKTMTILLGAFSVAAVPLSFFLLYWNHFVGYRAGGGIFIAWSWMMNHGFLPYKDFFCPVPIFYILRGAALFAAFDDHFISVRLCGMIERTVLAVLIYFWLSRFFTLRTAVVAAIVTSILGSCDIADPLDVYTQEAILMSVASALATSFALDEKRSARATATLAAVSGVFTAWALMTKQTIGLGSSVGIPFIAAASLYSLDGWKRAATYASGYLAGWLSCMGVFAGWLASHGILADFLQQAYVKGPAAKASGPMTFVMRFVARNRDLFIQLCISLVAIGVSWRTLIASSRETSEDSSTNRDLITVLLLGLGGVAIGAYFGYAYSIVSKLVLVVGRQVRLLIMLYMFYASCGLFALHAWHCFKKRISRREAQLFLYLALALSNAFMVSLSFPFYEAVLVPGLGLLTALLLDKLRGWRRCIICGLILIAICGAAVWKLRMPYEFEDSREAPVPMANKKSVLAKQAGFELPEDMNTFIDETAKIINENSTPEDTIYVYPDGALFYALCDRRCTTFSLSHNMDTTNDALARADAKLILEKRPAVLVYYRSAEKHMKVFEDCWRGGQPSGQRDILAACDTLAKEYRLVKTFHFDDRGLGPIDVMVYVRPR